MALASVGLSTYIWNNNLKCALLLLFYPFLLIGMLWGGAYLTQAWGAVDHPAWSYLTPAQFANRITADYGPYVFLAVLVWFVIAFFGHQRMIRAMTGARPVTRQEQPELYNLLENLCISRGIAMPQLYIIPDAAMNAFASGISEKTFAITVTQGLLDALDAQELETVLAHELTHIQNRDVRLLIFCLTFAGMLSFLAEVVGRSLRHGRSSGNSRGKGAGVIMLIAFLCLLVGYFFSVLLRFAISRKREFLADAGAVELTKNPGALVSALNKISGRSTVADVPADVRQLFFDNHPKAFSLFATHPSIEDRIGALALMGAVPYQTTKPLGAAGIQEGGPWQQGAQSAATAANSTVAGTVRTQKKAAGWFIKLFLMLFGAGLVFAGVGQYRDAGAYLSEGQSIQARVQDKWVETKERRDSNGHYHKSRYYKVSYRFVVDGQSYAKTASVGHEIWQNLATGSPVTVTYLASNPAKNTLSGQVPTYGGAWAMIGLGAVMGLGGLGWLLRRKREPETA